MEPQTGETEHQHKEAVDVVLFTEAQECGSTTGDSLLKQNNYTLLCQEIRDKNFFGTAVINAKVPVSSIKCIFCLKEI
ncbi:hypothetical protein AYI70_g5399 [Smittium culicis]|uniref:Uncharacterized protein n=1 Tax=Smittium culicis TaxID=133412 RepID=A0A1R1XUR2_9FUNG|nr:hypothetical protein AYI70_g5399 [Smittium culicis]